MRKKKALIVGCGPAGLTAAIELLKNSDVQPIVFEMSNDIGGISKTVNYKGNRIDIGGHRFFSKSTRVMNWWKEVMPIQNKPALDDIILKRKLPESLGEKGVDPEKKDLVLLFRNRLSRIFYLRYFFDYPISLKWDTFKRLGFLRIIRIGLTYVQINIFPIRDEKTLEEFLINRFGKELYSTFFKDYTEKVWGVSCNNIPADWGAQRIKGLSITKTLSHAIKNIFRRDQSLEQKETETSLIGQFLYPKLGPGQLWEEVARKVVELGGEIYFNQKAVGIDIEDTSVTSLSVYNSEKDEVTTHSCDYVISTMPVKELIEAIPREKIPSNVSEVAKGLVYRDFITVGLLLKKLLLKNDTERKTINDMIPDHWIYIQEKDVRLGRLQIFNNWSPYMVADKDTIWVGLEYFCNEGDSLWQKSDGEFIDYAMYELEHIGFIDKSDVLDSTLLRVPKTYPAYFGTYDRFDEIRAYTDTISNLFLIGRNGMHRYNNADHSMLTAMIAVENITNNISTKKEIWEVNTEEEYHEEK